MRQLASRAEVYDAIDGERQYQEGWKDPTLTDSQGKHSMQEFLTYIDSYTREALEIGARRPDKVAQRHSLRKIAALAVAAMEQNGVEYRNPTDNLKARHQ